MIRDEIVLQLKKALHELGIEGIEPAVEIPTDASKGDYSSNIAMAIFKKVSRVPQVPRVPRVDWKTPLELAQEIVNILNTKYLIPARNASASVAGGPNTSKVEAVKPGFINFWLSQEYLTGQLNEVLGKKGEYGTNIALKNMKIMLEFADPNVFKEFHIGHLRNITLGESFARLLEAKGAKLWRVDYYGDIGLNIAKAIYGIKQLQDVIPKETVTLSEKSEFLGKAYAVGSNAYETDENAKEEIRSINIKVYQMHESVKNLWDIGKRWSMEHFEQIFRRVDVKYKHYYPESATVDLAKELVAKSVQDGIFEASEGAIVFRGEKEGLHTRVFLTKEGYPTYEGKDLALAEIKRKDLDYERSIIITAHEQAAYFKVILAAMREVLPQLAAKTQHYSFGFVKLKEGKMSSRQGNIIAGEWLLDEAKCRIQKSYKEMDEETAEMVAVGAVKYSMLKFSREADIEFSFDESISLEGNSGPYLQYTYARTRSIARKSQISNLKSQINANEQMFKSMENGRWKMENEEVALLRQIARFPEIVNEAGEKFAPNTLCNYLFELAQAFNLFYQKHQIIGDVGEIRDFRVGLTAAVGQILKNGLYLLGIKSPEKM